MGIRVNDYAILFGASCLRCGAILVFEDEDHTVDDDGATLTLFAPCNCPDGRGLIIVIDSVNQVHIERKPRLTIMDGGLSVPRESKK